MSSQPLETGQGIIDPLAHHRHRHRRGRDPARWLAFYGEDYANPGLNYHFEVLAGDQPPTVVGGYAKQQVIDRPLRRGLLIFQGYDPLSLQFDVRFQRFTHRGGWRTDRHAGIEIEEDIQRLEWMAGQGYTAGPPPLVWLSAHNAVGEVVPLIPFQYQRSVGAGVPRFFSREWGPHVGSMVWAITDLSWDTSPLRNEDAYRVRQDASVTVQFHEVTDSNANRNLKSQHGKSVVFRSRQGADTPITIATVVGSRDAEALARAIMNFPANKRLHLRSIWHSKIRHGAKVHVPVNY